MNDYIKHKSLYVKVFVFNPFAENTYIVWDDTGEGVIIDPGCYTSFEKKSIDEFIFVNRLNIVRLLNTHCHLDHIIGNAYIYEKYSLLPEYEKDEEDNLKMAPGAAILWGLPNFPKSPIAQKYLEDGEEVGFGNSYLNVVKAPGHSKGHVFFLNKENNFIISGDIIFYMSIGRTDLPGGDYDTLMKSIKEKIMILPDDLIIYPGHGEKTTVHQEKIHNPFAAEWRAI